MERGARLRGELPRSGLSFADRRQAGSASSGLAGRPTGNPLSVGALAAFGVRPADVGMPETGALDTGTVPGIDPRALAAFGVGPEVMGGPGLPERGKKPSSVAFDPRALAAFGVDHTVLLPERPVASAHRSWIDPSTLRAFGADSAVCGDCADAVEDGSSRQRGRRGTGSGDDPFVGDWDWGPGGWSGPLTIPRLPGGGIDIPWGPRDPCDDPSIPPWERPWCFSQPSPLVTCPRPDSQEECLVPSPGLVQTLSGHDSHRVFEPAGDGEHPVIVLLHGRDGDPSNLTRVAEAFASACFRVIVLKWHNPPTLFSACNGIVDQEAFNACLRDERVYRLYDSPNAIVPELGHVLSTMGWSDALDELGVPRWTEIVIAGYSAGASQAAFIARELGSAGAIFISGGGDPGSPVSAGGVVAADWMSAVGENPRNVALYHEAESVQFEGVTLPLADDYIPAWLTLDGVAGTVADALPPAPAQYYQVFSHASRLVRQDGLTGEAAHQSTIQAILKPAHMYLACRAGGKKVL